MKIKLIVVMLVGSVFAASAVQASEPLALQKVMKDLGKNMQIITDGISREDWELVAQTAPMIAAHPQPPVSEKMRITAFMGADMAKFKAFDNETHEAAHDLLHAAHQKDGKKVIAEFQKVQTTCLNCHQTFRGRFVGHFYGSANK